MFKHFDLVAQHIKLQKIALQQPIGFILFFSGCAIILAALFWLFTLFLFILPDIVFYIFKSIVLIFINKLQKIITAPSF